jgi:hypothetical protein
MARQVFSIETLPVVRNGQHHSASFRAQGEVHTGRGCVFHDVVQGLLSHSVQGMAVR